MTAPLSQDLRQRIVRAVEAGSSRRQAAERFDVGASADPNPIEQLFAKLKALLCKPAARTQDALWDVIGQALDAFTPAECRNYLINAGYECV